MKRLLLVLLVLSFCGCANKEKPEIRCIPATIKAGEIEAENVYYWDIVPYNIKIGSITTTQTIFSRVNIREEIREVNSRIGRLEKYLNIEEVNEYKPAEEKIYYRRKK